MVCCRWTTGVYRAHPLPSQKGLLRSPELPIFSPADVSRLGKKPWSMSRNCQYSSGSWETDNIRRNHAWETSNLVTSIYIYSFRWKLCMPWGDGDSGNGRRCAGGSHLLCVMHLFASLALSLEVTGDDGKVGSWEGAYFCLWNKGGLSCEPPGWECDWLTWRTMEARIWSCFLGHLLLADAEGRKFMGPPKHTFSKENVIWILIKYLTYTKILQI